MPDPAARPPLREVIARHGLRAQRKLGQNFLLDTNLTAKIARGAGDLRDGTTIEVGPGPGGLTRALLDAGATVLAIELDPRTIPALAELSESADGRLTVVEGDAMAMDLPAECAARGLPTPLRVVANLPYNVGTALLIDWLGQAGRFESFTLMFQKEVADRLTALPNTKAYGRLSVLAQWLCRVERLFNLPAAAFTPAPKVVSTMIRLTPRPEPIAPASKTWLERVTGAAFGQRRKMLRQSLRSLGGDTERLIEAAGADPTARAEQLTVEQFCALARAAEAQG
ncbi:MAG: 16S rRNA (adenine(1518)-N(6)/adenine(1519)-N(6))-dimethyltransferase RsmA [Bauldia litoralis]